ncbi:MAG: nitronate monooxygenase [Stackebrandtia sp.]
MILDELPTPIVLAPMAGGPSTPELAGAVCAASGLGFLAAGYLDAAGTAARITALRKLTGAAFGVNLFVPGAPTAAEYFAGYLDRLGRHYPLGEARFDDDAWGEKMDLLTADPVPVVSCTFGCPSQERIERLHHAGSEVWVTVTSVAEARIAVAAGADVLVAQGAEAGGHRGGFIDRPDEDGIDPLSTLVLVQLLHATVAAPVVAAGGIATGAGVAAVLAAGATAAQLGTAFLRCPETGTSALHRDALTIDTPTMLTRAFSGRRARGLRNRFILDNVDAPAAYPEIHYATGPLRKQARADDNADAVNLWAGQAHTLADSVSAADLVRHLHEGTKAALESALSRTNHPC